MAQRPELEPYIGTTISIEASIISRKDGGEYGFLLSDITLHDGAYVDHCWLQIYDMDLAAVSGHRIRCRARISTYWKASRINGRYVEDAEEGTGISDIDDVAVSFEGEWLPLDKVATIIRRLRAMEIKAKRTSGTYIWPGAWTYCTGALRVKAAKSALPGSLCDVRSRNHWHDAQVRLLTQDRPGVWTYEKVPVSPDTPVAAGEQLAAA